MSTDIIQADGVEIVSLADGGSSVNKTEIEAQLDAAHKYRRSIKHFMDEAKTMATLSQSVAESCMYTLPRGGKSLTGPSVRLAEICASAYGNIQVGARVIGTDGDDVVAQGAAWDMEKNVRITIEERRRIVGSNGQRYKPDMIVVTGKAAASIALRNAIFRVVPRAYVDEVYETAKRLAVGDARSLPDRRADVVGRLNKMGVTNDQILLRVEKKTIDDIGLTELETLIGLGTAIKNGEASVEDAFAIEVPPAPVDASQNGRRMPLKGNKQADPRIAPEGG